MTDRLVRAVAWRRLDVLGVELCRLLRVEKGMRLDGRAHVLLGAEVAAAVYDVELDERFVTRSVDVSITTATRTTRVALDAVGGRWQATTDAVGGAGNVPTTDTSDGHELDGCVDVDIGFTPSTNTLPIRRLNLVVGESSDVDAAWVRFPELTVERLRQRYMRLAEDRYRYESLGSGFTAELVVDDDGLVVTYEGIWERVGEATG